ncbi:MAG: hypothetical protein IJT21_02970 [Synergistaceae bacterium]|nr:hypothetical protein [Synergistaceae bacterium]
MRKFLCACLLTLFTCTALNASDYDISGVWHIHGEGFVEKSFVRSSLELTGRMTLTTQTLREISRDIQELISGDETITNLSNELLDSDMKALTGYQISLELEATELGIHAWKENLPNGIRIPVLLPEMRPTNNNPFKLPAVTYDGLTYQLTFTSTESGNVTIKGYFDVDIVGTCELNSESSIWKDGSKEPSRNESSSSGCNSGFGVFALALILSEVRKFVRH